MWMLFFMLTKDELLVQDTMPEWRDISLALYKEFSETFLLNRIFKYYTKEMNSFDVKFKEWGIYHMLAMQHIDCRIGNRNFFHEIDDGLDFGRFITNRAKRARLMDNKDRIRMFACIYQVLKSGNCFHVQSGQIPGTAIRTDCILYKLIDKKGVNIGVRYDGSAYVPLTLLVDRAIKPDATTEKLTRIDMEKLEIIENEKIIETVPF